MNTFLHLSKTEINVILVLKLSNELQYECCTTRKSAWKRAVGNAFQGFEKSPLAYHSRFFTLPWTSSTEKVNLKLYNNRYILNVYATESSDDTESNFMRLFVTGEFMNWSWSWLLDEFTPPTLFPGAKTVFVFFSSDWFIKKLIHNSARLSP